MLLAYKYRIYPTKADKILLAKHFGCCRFLYNHFLTYRKSQYEQGNKVSYYITQKELTKMKALEEYSWLNEVSSQSLQMAIQQLDDAYKRFFRHQGGYPNYKSKHDSIQSCSFPQYVKTLGYEHNLSVGTVDYTRGGPSGGDGDSITIVAPSSYGSVKREALTF